MNSRPYNVSLSRLVLEIEILLSNYPFLILRVLGILLFHIVIHVGKPLRLQSHSVVTDLGLHCLPITYVTKKYYQMVRSKM